MISENFPSERAFVPIDPRLRRHAYAQFSYTHKILLKAAVLFFCIAGSSSDNDVTKMEGCPRSLMLNVDLKESFPTELTPSLKTVKQDKRIDLCQSQSF